MTVSSIWEEECRCRKTGHFRKVCQSKKGHAVHGFEVEGAQETLEGTIETVSIDLVHLSRNWSLITAHLEMHAGKNIIEIPYKIDTDSEGNNHAITYIQKLFKNTTDGQLKNP